LLIYARRRRLGLKIAALLPSLWSLAMMEDTPP
jgi:hypothetical protein